MLAVLGDEYIAQHCLNAYKREQEEKLFKVYVADTLYYYTRGKTIEVKYSDLLNGNEKAEQSEESGDEIKDRIMSGVNSLFRKGGKNTDESDGFGGNTQS